ncbi:transposase [Actinosynnema sp. ALI-1.44]|uniref:transposase n=1 Tax=Actinosynnema sp. ALI-1.44 TaxID=1933779 RepID=UPI0011778A8C
MVCVPTGLKQLDGLLDVTGTGLYGSGPYSAARLLGDVGDIARFPDRGRFATWNGTAPIEAPSGDQHRHQLNRVGNRPITASCTSRPSSHTATTHPCPE